MLDCFIFKIISNNKPLRQLFYEDVFNSIDVSSVEIFQKILYGINYTDYLFSLSMGAGKTFLMACFIYLDL